MRGYQSLGLAILALWAFFLAAQARSASVCDEDYGDCQTLMRFKRGVAGDPDGRLRSWDEANPLCNWTGVTCHASLPSRVVSLRLEGARLSGSLSPFLSNLSLLATLSLSNNTFRGEIPSSLGELSRLQRLDLSENDLQGQIPASLRGCRSLEFMDLTGNNISGVIPEELGIIENLTSLCLSVNRLSGPIPSTLSNLTELKRLELGVNYFTGKIPPEIGELRKLEIMYLHTNYFEGTIPSSLSNCSALREITLSENRLRGEIPVEIGLKMRNLEAIYFLMNEFSGKIPVSISNLSRLRLFDVSLNKLEGEVPMEFGKLENLENLQLHSNDLVSGRDNSSLHFLTALTNCTRLAKIHLGSCLFAGKLPDSIGGLSKQLAYFNLLDNRITGNIPESIGNLSGLVTMLLWHNFLDGKIPASLGKLDLLQRLNLRTNRLVGEVPGEIGKLSHLGFLDLSDNSIGGTIPRSLCDSGQLSYLYLSRNRLSGNLPIELLTRCSDLLLLDLSYNRLQGSVPVEISALSNLALSLNLSNNDFEGDLPRNIGELALVKAIDFSNNKLSGVIPSSIGKCIALQYLNFSNNMIEGPIPDSMKLILYLETLDLSRNRLNGSIPAWLGSKLEIIKFLNLSYNGLSGEVPRNGSFGNFNRSSFLGNDGLCGGSSRLGLPRCEFRPRKRSTRTKVLYSILVVIAVLLLFVAFFIIGCLFFKKREKKQDSTAEIVPSSSGIQWTRSYTERELEVATNGFSEDNLLGTGSFGSVYKAVVDNESSVVAVKVFHLDSSQGTESLKRECEILSNIKHRNLLRIVGSSWNSQFKALVLEFIPNGNLDQHLYPGGVEGDSCNLTLKERLSIAIDIANGLEYLQEGCPTQIVHCDLKPQNVLIDYDLVARIADFGIGKLLLDEPSEQTSTMSSFLRGSIGYIPPEYGQGSKVSVKGDVYSFGIMVLEMMTRKRPTSGFFSNGLNLRKWVLSCFPRNTMNVVDAALKNEDNDNDGSSFGDVERLEQCSVRVLNVALMCTEENPNERPVMSSVVQMLLTVAKDLRLEDPDDIEQVSKELKEVGGEEEERSILHEFR